MLERDLPSRTAISVDGAAQHLDDFLPLVRLGDQAGIAQDAPVTGLALKFERGLNFLEVAAATIQDGLLASHITAQYQDGIGRAGQSARATSRVEWIIGFHLARVVHQNDRDAEFERKLL